MVGVVALVALIALIGGCATDAGRDSLAEDLAASSGSDLAMSQDVRTAAGDDLAIAADDQSLNAMDLPVDLATTSLDLATASSTDLAVPPTFVAKSLTGAAAAHIDIYAIAGASGAVFFGESLGVVSTTNGGVAFTVEDQPLYGTVNAVWASPTRVVFGGENGLCHRALVATSCARFGDSDAGVYTIYGIAGHGSDVYAVGSRGAIAVSRDGGASWSWLRSPGSGEGTYRSVWVDANVVVVGKSSAGSSLRSTNAGVDWETIDVDATEVSSIWGTGSGDLWAVGCDQWEDPLCYASIHHSGDHGATWTKQAGITSELPELPLLPVWLRGVWGTSPTNLWAVGSQGTVLHSTDGGATWPTVSFPSNHLLRAIWGTSPSDIWIGGSGGIHHLE